MKKNILEWTVFAISLAVIGGVAGVLLHLHLTAARLPPSIAITAGEARETAGGFAVPVDVRNDGDTTAEEVVVEATLSWPDGVERAEATLAYVPYRSHRRIWMAFTHNPRDGRLTARVLGYREP